MSEDRFRKADFAAWIGIAVKVSLAFMKGTVGYISGSKALIADALHSAADVAVSFVVLPGLRTDKLPSEDEQHFGHSKAESIAAVIVSVLVLLVGLEVGISSVKAIYQGVQSSPGVLALVAVVISILVKEAMFQYKSRRGKKLSNKAMIANAAEHRSDIYSSAAAFIGVGGAVLGDYLGNKYLYYLEPIAGLFIAALVIRMGVRLVSDSILRSADGILNKEDAAELLRTVQTVNGVIAVDDLRAREQGHYVIVELKISVNPRISVLEGQDVAKTVKQTLMKRFIHVTDAVIHVHPYDPGYPYKNNVNPEPDDFPSLLH